MKELKVILLDKDTIQLDEDGKKGDVINLKTIANIDREAIDEAIRLGKDEEYNKSFKRYKEELSKSLEEEKNNSLEKQKNEYELKLAKLEGDLNTLKSQALLDKKEALNSLQDKVKELELKLASKEAEHNDNVNALKDGFKDKLEKELLQATKDKDTEIVRLKGIIDSYDAKSKLESNELRTELNKESDDKLGKLKEEYEEKLVLKDQELDAIRTELGVLKETKARLNNKEVGEDLEKYCDVAMTNLMQVGFDNCEWKKDTENIKEVGEDKGTKADFIYKIFLDESKTQELTSVCVEAKNEQIDSKNRLKNANHYDKLEKDRAKKKCQYSLLVSNLEQENENILPIYKVPGKEYTNMYVVRPVYLTTFITMITSLTMKFKDVIVADENKKLDLIAKQDFLTEFEKVKNTYLDKPLETLNKELENIRKANQGIQEASSKINQAIDNIINRYISEINSKIDKFTSSMTKSYKKLD